MNNGLSREDVKELSGILTDEFIKVVISEVEKRDIKTVEIGSKKFTLERYGKWKKGITGWVYCSECGHEPLFVINFESPYCPNCGTKMVQEEKHN